MTTTSTDWIPWSGGECPVPDDTMIEARINDGTTNRGQADEYLWSPNHSGYHVAAYRILTPTPLSPPGWSKGWHNPEGVESPGEGYRFLIKEEVDRRHVKIVSLWSALKTGEWGSQPTGTGGSQTDTYRIPISTPFPDPPKVEAVAEVPWRPTKGDWYQRRDKGDDWSKPIEAIADQRHYYNYDEYRPASPPAPVSNARLSAQLIDHILSQPSPEPNDTMQTQQNAVPPSNLPALNSHWTVFWNSREFKGRIVGLSESQAVLKTRWGSVLSLTQNDWRNCAKEEHGVTPETPEKSKPGILRRLVVGTAKAAFWTAVGAIFRAPLATAGAAGIAYLWSQIGK